MMKPSDSQSNEAIQPSVAGGPRHAVPVPAISQLPTELLAEILHSALSSTTAISEIVEQSIRVNMQRLYTLRRVAKQWQEVIEGTPTFWTTVLATLPPHVNDMIILRSKNCPLSVVYASTIFVGPFTQTPLDFFASIAHTRSRWSAYSGPIVSEYLESPAPLLQNIRLSSTFLRGQDVKPLELLGGCTTDLRQVDLLGVSIPWKIGMFVYLDSLSLRYLGWDGLSTSHLLDFLHASPYLRRLSLQNIEATTNSAPPLPIITLPQLRYLTLSDCNYNVTMSILHQIQAPSCINFSLSVFGAAADEFIPDLDETLQPFELILRAIHERNGGSEIVLGLPLFEWSMDLKRGREHHFQVYLGCTTQTSCIRWVERVLQNTHGLEIQLAPRNNLINVVLETIAPMRCVSTLLIVGEGRREQVLRILRFLGQSLSTKPSLPCLRKLKLGCFGWDAQDLLDMVDSRFFSFPWDTVDAPSLAIDMWRRPFSSTPSPRTILDYAVLSKVREAKGVDRVVFVGPKEVDGMLAIIWDGEGSKPVWF